jgi:hypothetical protein
MRGIDDPHHLAGLEVELRRGQRHEHRIVDEAVIEALARLLEPGLEIAASRSGIQVQSGSSRTARWRLAQQGRRRASARPRTRRSIIGNIGA